MNGVKKATFVILSLILIFLCLIGLIANAIPNKVTAQNLDPILFVHGWTRSSSDWNLMMEWFEADGWPNTNLYAYNFDDRSNCSIQANINNAHKIKQWVDDILNETGAEKVDLVGHSMGGLNSRYYIKFLDGIDKVDDYVSLGSPHHGENVALCGQQGVNALAQILNEGDETPGGILEDTLGNRLDPISGITYNSTHIPGNISYTSIYSLADAMPPLSPPLDGGKNVEIDDLMHLQLIQDESVYELVKAAIDDSPQNNNSSSFLGIPGIIFLMSTLIILKRKNRKH